jgi:hypothetical protein
MLSAVVHKLPWLAPTTTYEAFQLGLSKVLINTARMACSPSILLSTQQVAKNGET